MQLSFGERQFSAETILTGNWGDVSAYQQQTLAFCQRWLRGDDVFTLHTSGSTGEPKPIELHRSQMEASARLTAEAVGLRAGMSALIAINTAFVGGTMMLVRGMLVGLHMHVVEPMRNPMHHGPVDFTALVPMQVQAALDDVETVEIFGRTGTLLIGGGPVSESLRSRLQAYPTACYHTYGMTETVSHIALRKLNGPDASLAFKPFDGVTLALDARGCLTISGPMTLGKTITTNDIVTLNEDGTFIWKGRYDNVINSGGVKIQAEKVETALARAFGTDRLFVVGLPDETLGERVTAFVEQRALTDAADALEQRIDGLSRYERPKTFHYLDQFAETPSGKVDRLNTIKLADLRR